jgi:hypothetical protein
MRVTQGQKNSGFRETSSLFLVSGREDFSKILYYLEAAFRT